MLKPKLTVNLKADHYVRLKSWVDDDYLARSIKGERIEMRGSDKSWSGGLRELWRLEYHQTFDGHPPLFRCSLKSYRGDVLLASDKSKIIASNFTTPIWEPLLRAIDNEWEFRTIFNGQTHYLHRPKTDPSEERRVSHYEKDGVTGNRWTVEDLGPAAPLEFEDRKDLNDGDLIRFQSNFAQDFLVPRDKIAKVSSSIFEDLSVLWRARRVGKYFAFQSTTGEFLAGGATNSLIPEQGLADLDHAALWSAARSTTTGTWEVRNRKEHSKYLHRRGKEHDESNETSIYGYELAPGNQWNITWYKPETAALGLTNILQK